MNDSQENMSFLRQQKMKKNILNRKRVSSPSESHDHLVAQFHLVTRRNVLISKKSTYFLFFNNFLYVTRFINFLFLIGNETKIERIRNKKSIPFERNVFFRFIHLCMNVIKYYVNFFLQCYQYRNK